MNQLEDLRWTYLTGHALVILPTIPDETIDCIKTSPPYWGLRNYGEENNTIWDGDPDCEHEWGTGIRKAKNDLQGNPEFARPHREKKSFETETKYCLKCNAWYGQLGLEPTLKLFIDHLLQITNELKRVLKPTGVMFWNQGDCYGGSGGAGGDYNNGGLREGQPKYPRRPTGPHPLTPAGQKVMNVPVQAKCLALQNSRLLIRMVDEQGWIARNRNIWFKPCHMPSSAKNRFTNTYEPVYMLTKNNKPIYYYHEKTMLMQDNPPPSKRVEGIDWEWQLCDNCNGTGKVIKLKLRLSDNKSKRLLKKVVKKCGECNGKGKVKHSFWNGLDYWFDLDAVRAPFTKPLNRWGGNKEKIPKDTKWGEEDERSRWSKSVRDRKSRPNPSGKNPGDYININLKEWMEYSFNLWCGLVDESISDIWKINTASFPDAHFAVFPDKLVEKCLKAGCPKEICIKCGKPRVRVTGGYFTPQNDVCLQKGVRGSPNQKPMDSLNKWQGYPRGKTITKTIGWTNCSCNAGFKPGVVLDPFVGSGTVLKVARQLNRNAIGIDINPKYKAMGERKAKLNIPDISSFSSEVEV